MRTPRIYDANHKYTDILKQYISISRTPRHLFTRGTSLSLIIPVLMSGGVCSALRVHRLIASCIKTKMTFTKLEPTDMEPGGGQKKPELRVETKKFGQQTQPATYVMKPAGETTSRYRKQGTDRYFFLLHIKTTAHSFDMLKFERMC